MYIVTDGRGVMFVRGLEIELAGHRFTVAEPAADGVSGETISQLRLPSFSHRVERLAPRCQTGFAVDPVELSPHVLSRVPIPSDDELVFGIERLFQIWAKITEQRDHPLTVAFVVSSLWGRDLRLCWPASQHRSNAGPVSHLAF